VLVEGPRILLVEDNPGDVRLMVESLKETKVTNNLSVARDGEEALAFLRRKGAHADAPKPNLILLDLNLPKKAGHEVLAEIKQDPRLKLIPVVIVTSSDAERDIVGSYDLRANAYVSKPVGLDQFMDVIRSVERFWLSVARLPPPR
jgi:chemotaxis family two-component system response regulator Rcp1